MTNLELRWYINSGLYENKDIGGTNFINHIRHHTNLLPAKYLLETKWLQPIPVRVTRQKLGRTTVDAVEPRLPDSDWGIMYYVDTETLLAKGVATITRKNIYEPTLFEGFMK